MIELHVEVCTDICGRDLWAFYGPYAKNLPAGKYRLVLEGITTNYTYAPEDGIMNAFSSWVTKAGITRKFYGKKT